MTSKYVVTKINTFEVANKVFFASTMTEATALADEQDRQELLAGDLEGDWIVAEILPRGNWYVRFTLWLEKKLQQ